MAANAPCSGTWEQQLEVTSEGTLTTPKEGSEDPHEVEENDADMPLWLREASEDMPVEHASRAKPRPAVPWAEVSKLLDEKTALQELLGKVRSELEGAAQQLREATSASERDARRARHAQDEGQALRLQLSCATTEIARLTAVNVEAQVAVTEAKLDALEARTEVERARHENAALQSELTRARITLAGGTLAIVAHGPTVDEGGAQPTPSTKVSKATPESITTKSTQGLKRRGLAVRPANVGVLLETTPASKARFSSSLTSRLQQLQNAINDKENLLMKACSTDDLDVVRQIVV
jgi:hypothetical protein